mmetsp:Transcript_136272/g.353317  ORF Transcript_136272/g.353317 Transcript_136272/m.353317 type:complete len:292 (-) Transcript_136272:62-937(-)
MPQSVVMSGGLVALTPLHLSKAAWSVGPPNTRTPIFAPCSLTSKAGSNFCTMALDWAKPESDTVPLPSKRKITSSFEVHCRLVLFAGNMDMQVCLLHCSNSAFSPEQVPVPRASVFTGITRWRCPVLQGLPQSPHSDQSPNSQSALHAWGLQVRVSDCTGHGVPSNFGSCVFGLVRVCTPPPHSAVHSVHSVQMPTSQSTGHSWMLHFRSIFKGGHFVPLTGCETIVLVLSCVPPPHAALHASSVQSETEQSTMEIGVGEVLLSSPRIFFRPAMWNMRASLLAVHLPTWVS